MTRVATNTPQHAPGSPLRVAIAGASGRMGRMLIEAVSQADDCRLAGALFNASRWADVRFVDCRLDGADFRMLTAERVWFERCNLGLAEFRAATITHARFVDCDLTGTEFSQARIADARLHGSRLDGIRGVDGLQRPVITSEQAIPLAWAVLGAMGVVVDDDPTDEGDDV
mgnify:CR=1 FL=1